MLINQRLHKLKKIFLVKFTRLRKNVVLLCGFLCIVHVNETNIYYKVMFYRGINAPQCCGFCLIDVTNIPFQIFVVMLKIGQLTINKYYKKVCPSIYYHSYRRMCSFFRDT